MLSAGSSINAKIKRSSASLATGSEALNAKLSKDIVEKSSFTFEGNRRKTIRIWVSKNVDHENLEGRIDLKLSAGYVFRSILILFVKYDIVALQIADPHAIC